MRLSAFCWRTRHDGEMVQEGKLELDDDDALALPLESLAMMVLENFRDCGAWNRHNWLSTASRYHNSTSSLVALAEAFAWLETQGLLVWNPAQNSSNARMVTRAGHRALELQSLDEIRAAHRIGLSLHPSLEGRIRPVFLLGDYETAAFKAMKEVEVRVRQLAGLDGDLIGVRLMRRAFQPGGGPLCDSSLESGEQQARADLFAGALGSFKNPTSHRVVTYEDPTEASEVVLLADLLMRMLDQVEERMP